MVIIQFLMCIGFKSKLFEKVVLFCLSNSMVEVALTFYDCDMLLSNTTLQPVNCGENRRAFSPLLTSSPEQFSCSDIFKVRIVIAHRKLTKLV
jgi:hypothetical protein